MALIIDHTLTQRLQHRMLVNEEPLRSHFRGRTIVTAQTEITINGVAGYIYQPPENSFGAIEAYVMGFDNVAKTFVANTPAKTRCTYSRIGSTLTVTQNTDVTNVYDDTRLQFLADDTNDYVRVLVTAPNTNETFWEVSAEIYCFSYPEAALPSGIYDGKLK